MFNNKNFFFFFFSNAEHHCEINLAYMKFSLNHILQLLLEVPKTFTGMMLQAVNTTDIITFNVDIANLLADSCLKPTWSNMTLALLTNPVFTVLASSLVSTNSPPLWSSANYQLTAAPKKNKTMNWEMLKWCVELRWTTESGDSSSILVTSSTYNQSCDPSNTTVLIITASRMSSAARTS